MRYATIIVLVMLAGISFAGITVPEWSLSQESFSSGSSGVMSMTLSNSGEHTMTGVGITIEGSEDIKIRPPASIVDLRSGATTTLALPFTVDGDAKSGIYRVEIRFLGYEDVPGGSKLTVNSVVIPIKVLDSPELGLTMDRKVLGGIDPAVLSIENNGGIANEVRIKMNESSDIALYGTNEIFLEHIEGIADVPMILDSRGSDEGPKDLSFVFSYEDELGMRQTESEDVRVTIRKERLDLAFIQKNALTTRKEAMLSLEIRNNGKDDLKDVRISFNEDGMRLKEDNEIDAGDIPAGGSATVSATVFADYAPGLNLIESTVSWIEEDVEKTRAVDMPVTIQSDAKVGVYLEAKPAPITNNVEHTISVLVSNLGSHEIDNVEVGLESDVITMLDISEKRYIGSLENDDFSTVQFKVMINAPEAGDYPLDVIVDFRDQSGQWATKKIDSRISVNAAAENGGIDMVIIIPAVIALGIVIWYFKFRKKDKKE
jgi:hypothetical protein